MRNFQVTFAHNRGNKTFHRTIQSKDVPRGFTHRDIAVSEAQDGYQAAYGTWPGAPLFVREQSNDGRWRDV